MPAIKKTETLKDKTIKVVHSLKGPTSVDTVKKKILSVKSEESENYKKSNATLRNYLKDEIGISLVYLDQNTIVPIHLAFKGLRFRINIDALDEKRYLYSTAFEPFLKHSDINKIQFVDKHCTELDIKFNQLVNDKSIWNKPSYILLEECFPGQKIQAGDSILVTIIQYEPKPLFCLEYETASERQEEEIQKKNQELADIVFDILENEPQESIMIQKGIPTAYCRLQDPCNYPGDNWRKAIHNDPRMCYRGFDIVYAEHHCSFDAVVEDLTKILGKKEKSKLTKLSLNEANQVYCWKVSLKHKPKVFKHIELHGKDTLAHLDNCLRKAFKRDSDDHLGGFWRMIQRGSKKRFREVPIADIEPFGKGKGSNLRIADLKLQEGSMLKYVYDFGSYIEHILVLESISQRPS